MRTLGDLNRVLNDLATSANTDIAPIINPTRPEGGYFGVPRSVFWYINFLGLLYDGWKGLKNSKDEKLSFGSSSQAKKYIKEIMGAIYEPYRNNGDILYEIYRHGTVHVHAPKKMVSKKYRKRSIEWLIYKGDRESWQHHENRAIKLTHLELIEWEENRFILPLSINILYSDLLESIELYGRKVHNDKSSDLLGRFSSVVDALDGDFDKTPFDFW